MYSTNEYLKKHESFVNVASFTFKKPSPKAQCADGWRISIQASSNHYCSPRQDRGPYYEVELGFPSEAEPDLLEYAEEPHKPTATIYSYVPVDVVDALLAKHGGITHYVLYGEASTTIVKIE